jgi:hypothetical protein
MATAILIGHLNGPAATNVSKESVGANVLGPVLQRIVNKTTMDVITKAEELQKDCHLFTSDLNGNVAAIQPQDATNVWLFKKLAELELRLQALEESNS